MSIMLFVKVSSHVLMKSIVLSNSYLLLWLNNILLGSLYLIISQGCTIAIGTDPFSVFYASG